MSNEAWQITSPGVLTLKAIGPVPRPGPKEALVRINAVSLNSRDQLVMEHNPAYPLRTKANLIPCSDGAGIVEESGPHSIWKQGDRVVIHPNNWKHGSDGRDFKFDTAMGGGVIDGTLRRYLVASDDSIFRAPNVLTMEEASTL